MMDDRADDPGREQDPRKRLQELEQVNDEFAELVQILLDYIEGDDTEEYSYSFQSGWKEKEEDSRKEELGSDDLDAQLREIRHLKEQYR